MTANAALIQPAMWGTLVSVRYTTGHEANASGRYSLDALGAAT